MVGVLPDPSPALGMTGGGGVFELTEMYRARYNKSMMGTPPHEVVFFRSDSGREPVRDWLKSLDKEDRKKIGEDIRR